MSAAHPEFDVGDEALCIEPGCPLQECDDRWLARLIVAVLAGEDVADRIEASPRVVPREECEECALRVMHGERPLPTLADLERALETGHWSHRRRRRRLHQVAR